MRDTIHNAPRELVGTKVLTALLVARPGSQDELQQTLRSLMAELQAQPGCIDCVLTQDVTSAPRFLLYVVWVDALAMQRSMFSDPFRVLMGAASTLGDPDLFRLSVTGPEPAPAPARIRCRVRVP